jgi:hypothetical protein
MCATWRAKQDMGGDRGCGLTLAPEAAQFCFELPVRYDLHVIHEFCEELGFRSRFGSDELLEIELDEAVVLFFQNAEREDDCLMGFKGTTWHAHGDMMFADGRGSYVEISYLDVITGLQEGFILVCELWRPDQLSDRWLIHRDYHDEFKYMEPGDEIRVHRIQV